MRLAASLLVIALAGCAAPRHPVSVGMQTTALPQPPAANGGVPTGGVFNPAGYRPLFEDRKPRYVGDILTIQINERLNASQRAKAAAERKSEFGATIPGVRGFLGTDIRGLDATAQTSNTFDGKGETASSNLFTGTITVTVIEVLANGNLRVAGEKQIGIRHNSEVLRFSGVVNPAQIQPGNVVSSTQVADARLDYRGGGHIDESLIQGWLARFFNSVSPF